MCREYNDAPRCIIISDPNGAVVVVAQRSKDNLWRARREDREYEDVASTVERAIAIGHRMVGRR